MQRLHMPGHTYRLEPVTGFIRAAVEPARLVLVRPCQASQDPQRNACTQPTWG